MLTVTAIGLTLTTGQRMLIDQISGAAEGGASVLAITIGSAVLGLSLVSLIVMLVRRVRAARWLTVALELVILLCGVLLIPVAVSTGFFDLENLWITVATVPAPVVIIIGLLVDRAVRGRFKSASALSAIPNP